MYRIKETIIVEGNYDKIKLDQIVRANIIVTDGFSIYSDKDKMSMIKQLAQKNKIVILTDSDRAGFQIRNYIKNQIPEKYVKHAYIPSLKGTEKRKRIPGKEGILGVEGIKNNIIIQALKRAGCIFDEEKNGSKDSKQISNLDFYNDGLSGQKNSKQLRNKLTKRLNLPQRISTSSLLKVLNDICTYDEYKKLVKKIKLEE